MIKGTSSVSSNHYQNYINKSNNTSKTEVVNNIEETRSIKQELKQDLGITVGIAEYGGHDSPSAKHMMSNSTDMNVTIDNVYEVLLSDLVTSAESTKTSDLQSEKGFLERMNERLEQLRQDQKRSQKSAKEQAKEQAEVLRIAKICMRIASRIIAGDNVPQADERFLRKNDAGLYVMAKTASHRNDDPKDYESLLTDEDESSDKEKTIEHFTKMVGGNTAAEAPISQATASESSLSVSSQGSKSTASGSNTKI